MTRTWRLGRLVAVIAALVVAAPGASRPAAQSAGAAPADVRALLEGTWRLDEWHLNGQILKPPVADGLWSNHDGVVMFMLHRQTSDTAESTMGYGLYQMDAQSWGYRYTRRETTTGAPGGPGKVTISKPEPEMRMFKMRREGAKIILEGAPGDHREYEGPYFTFFNKGQIVRRWRKVQ